MSEHKKHFDKDKGEIHKDGTGDSGSGVQLDKEKTLRAAHASDGDSGKPNITEPDDKSAAYASGSGGEGHDLSLEEGFPAQGGGKVIGDPSGDDKATVQML
jgi:hypothetical protein